MNYRSAVAEAKRLIKRSEEDQWRLAELTAEVLAEGRSLREWATDIGLSTRHVGVLRDIWGRWGVEDLHTRPKFSDAYATVLSRSAETITAGQRQERRVPTHHEDRVEMAQKLLDDQRVVAEVMGDRISRKSLRQAADDADTLDRTERPRREAAGDIEAVAEVQARIVAVARAIRTLDEIDVDPEEFALQVRNREPGLLDSWDDSIPNVVSFLQALRRTIKAAAESETGR